VERDKVNYKNLNVKIDDLINAIHGFVFQ